MDGFGSSSPAEFRFFLSGLVYDLLTFICLNTLSFFIPAGRNGRWVQVVTSKSSRNGGKGSVVSASSSKAVTAGTMEVESGGEAGGKLVHFDGPFVFTADDLLCATAEIMGKSTYGTAYKATLEDGNQVAVKRLREKITKGQKEFEIEVSEIGKIRYLNVLALRAYYLGPKGEKLLVYDYMHSGSLASFLHARGPETSISWPTRMTIILGITKGLFFLHTKENLVHGNLTSSNILLEDFTAILMLLQFFKLYKKKMDSGKSRFLQKSFQNSYMFQKT